MLLCTSTPAQGYSVCSRCFGDEHIKAFIESAVDSQLCDFCGRRGRTRQIAAPLDEVVEFMAEAIEREYEWAVGALGWDGQEGGYQGSHWDGDELLRDLIGLDLPNDDDGRLFDVLVDCVGDEPWCESNPYSLREEERLNLSWKQFCEFIKHERRYFFHHQQQEDREILAPSELLTFIGKTVEQHELVRKLPSGSLIYRARQYGKGKTLISPYDFGPPPIERAVQSNRMSPAGVVMFYGSSERTTATAEIDDNPRLGIAVGTFRLMREAVVLDLTRLPNRLGFFEQQSDSSEYNRYAIDFLHSFVHDLAAKVKRGTREYIDYVPTQVVTEWFRTVFRHDGSLLDGIYYPSTQRRGGQSVVLFANQDSVFLGPKEINAIDDGEPLSEWWLRNRNDNAWLKLVRRWTLRHP